MNVGGWVLGCCGVGGNGSGSGMKVVVEETVI